MRLIRLTQKKWAFIDDCDYPLVSKYKWCTKHGTNTFYAIANVKIDDGKWTTLLMHRLIMGVTDPMIEVDHKNNHGLVNLRNNLRSCSHAENQHNQQNPSNNTSGYKGVSWYKHVAKWRAQINFNGKRIHLGYFDNKIEAAIAYNEAAVKYHGEFACINVIPHAWAA